MQKLFATKASKTLAELLPNTLSLNIPHLAERQTWLIEEAFRIDEAIKSMDKQIASLLYGDKEKDINRILIQRYLCPSLL